MLKTDFLSLTPFTGVTSTDSQLIGTPAASKIFWTLDEISGPIPSPEIDIELFLMNNFSFCIYFSLVLFTRDQCNRSWRISVRS